MMLHVNLVVYRRKHQKAVSVAEQHSLIDSIFSGIFRGDESDYSEDALPYGENRSDGSASSASKVEKTSNAADSAAHNTNMTKYVADAHGEVFGTANDQVVLHFIRIIWETLHFGPFSLKNRRRSSLTRTNRSCGFWSNKYVLAWICPGLSYLLSS